MSLHKLSVLFFSILIFACEPKKAAEQEEAPSSEASADEKKTQTQTKELNVEEDSLSVLQEHISDLQAFVDLARGSDSNNVKYPEIANHANQLLVHYQFEVVPKIRSKSFRDAAYAFDQGELFATRLADTYDLAFAAKQELGDAWQTFQTSRELILSLREEWGRY